MGTGEIARFPRLSPQGGLTLVETLTTLAVASILLTAAIPPMQDFVIRTRMSVEVNNFIASTYLARSEAVKRLQNVVLCSSDSAQSSCSGSSDWESGWIVFVDLNNDGAVSAGEPILQQNSTLPSHFRIIGNQALFSYNSTGKLNNNPITGLTPAGHNKFCDTDDVANTRNVYLSNEGRVRVDQLSTLGCS
jgi:type IV fimbrial biogenesis protein FimT